MVGKVAQQTSPGLCQTWLLGSLDWRQRGHIAPEGSSKPNLTSQKFKPNSGPSSQDGAPARLTLTLGVRLLLTGLSSLACCLAVDNLESGNHLGVSAWGVLPDPAVPVNGWQLARMHQHFLSREVRWQVMITKKSLAMSSGWPPLLLASCFLLLAVFRLSACWPSTIAWRCSHDF